MQTSYDYLQKRYDFENLIAQWNSKHNQNGMRLNLNKIEYFEGGILTDRTVVVEATLVFKIKDFKYLGSQMSYDGDSNSANVLVFYVIDKSSASKLKGYRSVLRIVALYGAVCRPTSKKHEEVLH